VLRLEADPTSTNPTQIDLQSLIAAHAKLSEIHFLHPNFKDGVPILTMDEDSDRSLADQANTAFIDQLYKHAIGKGDTELLELNGRLNFIRGSLGYGDHRLARRLKVMRSPWEEKGDATISEYLGITENQVERGDMRGRRQEEIDKFEGRFNGLFTLSSILAEFVDDAIDRRVVIKAPNGKLSDMSIADALEAGFVNIAIALALMAVRQNEESQDHQTTPEINDNPVAPNPEDYKPESVSDVPYDLLPSRPEGDDFLVDEFDDRKA
jgi:hypothetical protein